MTQTLFLSRFFSPAYCACMQYSFHDILTHTDSMGGLCAPGSWTHVHWIKEEPLEHLRILERGTKKQDYHPIEPKCTAENIVEWKFLLFFFFLCREEIKECLFIHSDGGQSDTAKSALSGRCWIFFFSFSSSYIRKNIQQRKANGRFRLFSFFSADTYLFFPSARYLSILSIYHSFPIWNIQHDSMHLNQDIYCCVLPFALPNFLAMCHHTADFTCR